MKAAPVAIASRVGATTRRFLNKGSRRAGAALRECALVACGTAFWMAWPAFAGTAHAAEAAGVRISELHYHPLNAIEFIEIIPEGETPVELSGAYFSGIQFVFPEGTRLDPGTPVVLVSSGSIDQFQAAHPGVIIAGTFEGKLANEGERITLLDRSGRRLDSVTYDDGDGWPEAADGSGSSLERVRLRGNADEPGNWRASAVPGGTPGQLPDEEVPASPVRLNEIGAVSGNELMGAGDWVELANSGSEPADLSGWSLTDQAGSAARFVFPPGTTLQPGEFLLIGRTADSEAPLALPFGLAQEGEALYLLDAQGTRIDFVEFGPQVPNVTTARSESGWLPGTPTPGEVNRFIVPSPPGAGSLRINEWMANPLPGEDDWIEICNRSGELIDAGGLRFASGNGAGELAPHSFIEPGGYLVVRFDGQTGGSHIPSKLSAGGDYVELRASDGELIDHVEFGPQAEGVTEGLLPDGSGFRSVLIAGNSPGASNVLDVDLDGLPDEWEAGHGLDPADRSDAQADADGDGAGNADEFAAGTDPRDPESVLKLHMLAGGNGIKLQFEAQAGKSYAVFESESVASEWQRRQAIEPSNRRWIEIPVDSMGELGFVKVVTPSDQGGARFEALQPPAGSDDAKFSMRIRAALPSDAGASDPAGMRLVLWDGGVSVPGRSRLGAQFRTIEFEPDLPLTAATSYRAVVENAGGDELYHWSFRTRASQPLVENRSIYEQDTLEVREMRVQLFERPGGATWPDLLRDDDAHDEFQPEIEVLFTEGEFGSGESSPNGSIRVRGDSTRWTDQKSFRIELNRPWRGHQVLCLNKHPYDLTRVRNKLSFDLLRRQPGLASLRTSFAHLYVDGADYGLFTQVENPGPEFLAAHGLDPKGQLYKAAFFEFFRYADQLRLKSDPLYRKAAFEQLLEVKGDNNHGKLLRMLDELNDPAIGIDAIIERHFNRENYLAWLAFNILTRNIDTSSRNFYLYSPAESPTWYFIHWDCDGAWDFYRQPDQSVNELPRWQLAIGNWWGAAIHERFLRSPENLLQLTETIDRMFSALSPEIVREELDRLYPVVRPFIETPPDSMFLPARSESPVEEFTAEFFRLAGVPGQSRIEFETGVEWPMPVFLGAPEFEDGRWTFRWSASEDLQGDGVTYDFELSTDPSFAQSNLVKSIERLTGTEISIELPAGEYFWRVVIRDGKAPSQHWQLPFDSHYDESGERFFGMQRLTVP